MITEGLLRVRGARRLAALGDGRLGSGGVRRGPAARRLLRAGGHGGSWAVRGGRGEGQGALLHRLGRGRQNPTAGVRRVASEFRGLSPSRQKITHEISQK